MALISGSINYAGTAKAGDTTLFSSSKTSAGKYRVKFSTALSGVPVVVVSPYGGSNHQGGDNVFLPYNISAGGFDVNSEDVSNKGSVKEGTKQDAGFSFLAVG